MANSRANQANAVKYIITRDKRPSAKASLGKYLSNIDWSSMMTASMTTCQEKLSLFESLIKIGIESILPPKQVRISRNDPPWITKKFKKMIKKRQKALSANNPITYRIYRNLVNRERKQCRSKFYENKVQDLKDTKPKNWWRYVKSLSGMSSTTPKPDLTKSLQVDGIDDRTSTYDIANIINNRFLEPMVTYTPLTSPDEQVNLDQPTFLYITEEQVFSNLKALNPSKATGPDGLPSWIFKEYSEILAYPVSEIINSSYSEQRLPPDWKQADIVPIIKSKPVKDICKQLRPISLTPVLSKIAEEFVVKIIVKPAILSMIDQHQFGCIPGSSTTHALISMVDTWSKATDGTGAVVRVVFLDYKKAFDLIDHGILVTKLKRLNMEEGATNWVIDFLTNRQQRVKLASDSYKQTTTCQAGQIVSPNGVIGSIRCSARNKIRSMVVPPYDK